LLVAYAKDEFTISRGIVRKAIEDIRGGLASGARLYYRPRRIWRLVPALVALLVFLFGLYWWTHRQDMAKILFGEQVASVPVPEKSEKTGVPIPKPEKASVFLDEQASLAGLFRLFEAQGGKDHYADDSFHVGLFPFTAELEKYKMFTKPFRILIDDRDPAESPNSATAAVTSTGPAPSPRYLLAHEITAQGAVLVDAEGNLSTVSSDFLEINRGHKVSWVHPYENNRRTLRKGMGGPSVLNMQWTLKEIGYPVEPTGILDDQTVENIKEFQTFFGLKSDGIVGHRTKALLYMVSE
jgi:hypothetical protein